MLLMKSKYLLLAGVAAISLSLAGCGDDAKNDNSGGGSGSSIKTDFDSDGVVDLDDNCPKLANPNQEDKDGISWVTPAMWIKTAMASLTRRIIAS